MSVTTQTSQAALHALERAELVIAAIRTQKPLVAAALARCAGASAADWEALQEHHARLLERSAAELRRADQDHRHLLLEATRLRRHHRDVAARVKGLYRTLRNSVAGIHGEDALPLMGLGAPPARTFLALREQARELLARLRDPTLHLPPARHGHEPIRRLAIAAAIEPDVTALAAVLADLRRIEKRLDESLSHKHQTLAAHHRVYLNLARIQEGYYRLARLDALAERIRSERQQRSQGGALHADPGLMEGTPSGFGDGADRSSSGSFFTPKGWYPVAQGQREARHPGTAWSPAPSVRCSAARQPPKVRHRPRAPAGSRGECSNDLGVFWT